MKLTVDEARAVRALFTHGGGGWSLSRISETFAIPRSTVTSVVYKRHLPEDNDETAKALVDWVLAGHCPRLRPKAPRPAREVVEHLVRILDETRAKLEELLA